MFYRIQSADRNVNELLAADATSASYIDCSERAGVSVMTDLETLAAYVAQGCLPLDPHNSVLVTLDGEWSDEEDEDADLGAHLVHPTKIIKVEALESTGFFDMVDAILDAA